METLAITWSQALNVWWLIMWRSMLGGFLLLFAVNFVISFVGALAGVSTGGLLTSSIIGVVISLLWGIVVVRMALCKKYRHFRLVLSPHTLN
jgi:hypothetical protein